jgi:hypothetical protein
MSRTYNHIILGKFKNGSLQDINEIPIRIRKMWDRHNFDKGEFLTLRIKKKEERIHKEMINQKLYGSSLQENS